MLGPAYFSAISVLIQEDKPLTSGQICYRAGLGKSCGYVQIFRMVRKGLLHKEDAPEEARGRRPPVYTVTSLGKREYKKTKALYAQKNRKIKKESVAIGHCDRCPRCGEYLVKPSFEGCVPGKCSKDPAPPLLQACPGCSAPYDFQQIPEYTKDFDTQRERREIMGRMVRIALADRSVEGCLDREVMRAALIMGNADYKTSVPCPVCEQGQVVLVLEEQAAETRPRIQASCQTQGCYVFQWHRAPVAQAQKEVET